MPGVFKSPTSIWFTFCLLLVVFVGAMYASFMLVTQGNVYKGVAVLVCAICIVIISVLISFGQQSDIVIDEQSISRKVFGKTWQRIQWSDVRDIHSGLTPRFSRAPVKCCWIYPTIESQSKCRFIAFCFERNDIDALLDLINLYISKNDIKIISSIPGEVTQLTRLTV